MTIINLILRRLVVNAMLVFFGKSNKNQGSFSNIILVDNLQGLLGLVDK